MRRAEQTAWHGRESMRFNPRRMWARATSPSTEDDALHTLYEVAAQLQHVTETLVTSGDPDTPAPRTGPEFDRTLAGALGDVAGAVAAYQSPPPGRVRDGEKPASTLAHVRDRRAALARLVPWPGERPPKDWSVHAATLLATERALQSLLDA